MRAPRGFDDVCVLLHQGIGLGAFNAMPERKAVHALYECANSFTVARDLARGRPYASHEALFRRADGLLFALPEWAVDEILETCSHIGRRPRSAKSMAEQCSVWDDDPNLMNELNGAARRYASKFHFTFVMCVDGWRATDVLAAIDDRMHHDEGTERKVLRNELAKINRTRIERMLGPEGGYHNW